MLPWDTSDGRPRFVVVTPQGQVAEKTQEDFVGAAAV